MCSRRMPWKKSSYFFLLIVVFIGNSFAKKKSPSGNDVIEEVDRKKLEKLISEEEFLAVFFYNARNCKDCGLILEELERIDDDAGNFGVAFVKNSEKSTSKKFGVTSFPSLVYFRNQQPAIFDGDLKDEEKVLAYLTDVNSMELPDQIEEVNAKILENMIEDTDFLGVLIYEEGNELSEKVLSQLEEIDDEAHAKDIGFVKIFDDGLASDLGLDNLPALIYYRKGIPLLYDGDLLNEEAVLEYLIEFKDLGDEGEAIQDVSANTLQQLIEESAYLAVLFYDIGDRKCQRVLEELEDIDDDTGRHGIPFVKIDDKKIASEYGIEHFPALLYFEKKMPNFFQGDLAKEEHVLDWLIKQMNSDEIEDVSDKVLQLMIKNTHELSVLFYNREEDAHMGVLRQLEHVDDEMDKLGIPFVKIDDIKLAEDYALSFENLPALVFFENQVPNFFQGDISSPEVVLDWLKKLQLTDEIESLSDAVIEFMINKCDYLAILFCNSNDPEYEKVIYQLEKIDDESDKAAIPLVRSESNLIAEAYGIMSLPALVYFEGQVPNVYEGDLFNENEVLKFLLEQKSSDEIEDISSKVLQKILDKTEHLAVLFYDKNSRKSMEVLKELESLDDESEYDLPFVRIDDEEVAKEFGVENDVPVLVYFKKKVPSVYQGDLTNEEYVWKWLEMQLTTEGIEEVTDKILYNLIYHHDHLAVLFYDHKSKKSAKVLKQLESIDDNADKYQILIVKTDDVSAAEAYDLHKLPALIFFNKGTPKKYEGNLMREEEVLQYLIDQQTDDEIEEITNDILNNLIENNEYVAIFFYDKDAEISEQILRELENIGSFIDRHGISFVRIDDDSVAKEFGILDELPSFTFFKNKVPSVYEGNLLNGEDVLKWIITQKEEDTIEEVTEEILEEMIKEFEYVLVFFAPDECPECERILYRLESIDDETDDHGIMFVKTDDMTFAKKQANVKKFPAVILFRNGVPVVYKGDLQDEKSLLHWVTSEEALDIPDRIEEVNTRMLDKMLDTSSYVAVFFTEEGNPNCEKILEELEKIDHDAEAHDIDFVKISDTNVALEYGIIAFPTLVFFKNRFPQFYEGNLMEEDNALKWLFENKEKKDFVIEYVDRKMLDVLLDDVDHIAVFFYEEGCVPCEETLQRLEKIDGETDRSGIYFVKTDDVEHAEDLGVSEFPSLLYFEHKTPSIFPGNLMKEAEVLNWLLKQKNEDTIENINREMLFKLIEDQAFLAVFFYEENDPDSEDTAHRLERIDDDCAEYGVHLVRMSDKIIAKKYGIRNFPGLIFFRNGKHIRYLGDVKNEDEVLEYLTNPENMAVHDAVEKVNDRLFDRVLKRFEYVAAFFYSKTGCKLCSRVLDELEQIDDEAESMFKIHIIKVDDFNLAKRYGVLAFPALLFFKQGEAQPISYSGDIRSGERMLDWMLTQQNPNTAFIEEIEGAALRSLMRKAEHLSVLFYNKKLCSDCDEKDDIMECEDCQIILDELENIDDVLSREGIQFIKTPDLDVAKKLGITVTPALVYFDNQRPSIFEGDLADENDVLSWLIREKNEDTIENVNREMLEKLIEESEYLAVLFHKSHCRACDLALEELEYIDHVIDEYGIHLVRIHDTQVAKRYGIKTYPALVYFRNGNPLIYDGDLKNKESVLDYLIDDDNRELPDAIETVNLLMLNKLVEESPFLAVFFYDQNSFECERVLMALEDIDDECDVFGIDMVKIQDLNAEKQWNVESVPAVAFFRKQVPMFFNGDLFNEAELLKWLTSNDVFEIEDEIEEVNRKMLEKLLEQNEFIAVFFYDKECTECDEALQELERIDDEADDLQIMFVKIRDPRHARKYGVSQLPSLVYFRKKFPSVYRGNLLEENDVLEWLRKNRYRHPELNIFMYGLAVISLSFVLYTVILVFCFNKKTEKRD